VDDLVQAMGMAGISKSEVSRICQEIDGRVNAFLDRPIEGEWPYLWIAWERRSQAYVQVREQGRIISTAVIIATGVNTDGRRAVLGMSTGPSEADGVDGPLPGTAVPEWRLSSAPQGGRPLCMSPRSASISPSTSSRSTGSPQMAR
jgi:hypothetical protein